MGVFRLPRIATVDRTPLVLQIGELVYDITENRLYKGDGTTAGGLGESIGGGGTWGSITGTLSDQIDLQTVLDNKLDISVAATTYSALGHTHTFTSLTSKPTTLAGYGITDAALGSHTHTFASLTSKPTTLSGYSITDAYPLIGNPSGFLTSFSETDPTVASYIKAITALQISHWDSAYGWGNHASAGYLSSFSETDPIWLADKPNYLTSSSASSTYQPLGSYILSTDADYLDLLTDQHTHSNKALLDTYTQTEVNLADAVSKKHSHSNLTALNAVSGTNTGDQVISDATISTTDITTNNVSITKHGFTPKAPNDATKYLDGTGTWSVPASGGGGDTTTTEGALINSATSKTTPVDADYLGLMDSAASNILKKLSWANIKATLKTYFDTLYPAISYGAYKFRANNTNGSANPTEQTFRDVGEQAISSTITWTGGAAPTTVINNTYSWTQVGKLVTARFNLSYTTNGTTLTVVAIDLPTDLPTPVAPTGFTGSGSVLYYGTGAMALNASTINTNYCFCGLVWTGSVYQVQVSRSSNSAKYAWATITYWTT